MRTTIDKSLIVSWCLELEDGTRWFEDSTALRSNWLKAKEYIHNNGVRIKRMHLFNTTNAHDSKSFAGALTPEFCDGYFFMNKFISNLSGQNIEAFALGHVVNNNEVEIRWYDTHMHLLEKETRPIDKCVLGLIRNNS